MSVENSWCDFSMPIGLDHRRVHCQLKLLLTKPKKREKILSFKNWRPNLDENNVASDFQSKIRTTTNMEILENMFFLGEGVAIDLNMRLFVREDSEHIMKRAVCFTAKNATKSGCTQKLRLL